MNTRIKNKHLKLQIMHLGPRDVVLVKCPTDKDGFLACDLQEACKWFNTFVNNVLPDDVSAAFVPFDANFRVFGIDVYREWIEKMADLVNGTVTWGEIPNDEVGSVGTLEESDET